MHSNRIASTAIVGLVGAIIGSFSMMLFASTHFAGIGGPGNTPPQVYAAPITSGGSDQQRIVSAVRRVAPSVVSLNVTVNGQQVVPLDPFAQMFGQQGPQQVQRYRARASGSGFVYERRSDSSGLIVTNAHVVRPPTSDGNVSSIQVVFRDGQRVPAHVYSSNIGADLALIKVDGVRNMPPPVEIADSSKLEAGQFAIAIGEPYELKQSVSLGIVSGFNRNEPIGEGNGGAVIDFKGLLQTSAPINPGNSGGPLIDEDGRLIGVNQSTANPQSGAQGIGFAIPANTVKQQVALLQKSPGTHQGTNEGFIGASLETVTPSVGVQINYHGKGVAVGEVISGGPADQAGLQPGDVIQKVDGTTVTTNDEVVKAIQSKKPGQTVNFEVWSGGVKKLVSVKLEERPANVGALTPQQQPEQQDPNAGP